MPELHVLLISDGRPGHIQLSDGIIQAVARRNPVSVTRLDISRGRWPGLLLALASNTRRANASLLRYVYGVEAATLPQAGLVVSAGAATLAANVACSRLLGAANIFYGSLRAFNPASFNLVLTSYREQSWRLNHAFACKPSRVAAEVRATRRDVRLTNPPRIAGLLIGGPSGECRFETADWNNLIGAVTSTYEAFGVRWRVSNSRRTPPGVSDRIASMVRDQHPAIERFLDVRTPNTAALTNLLIGCDAVIVTDDSSSMISEVVAAGLPVLGASPAWQTLTINEYGYRQSLMAPGWYRSVPLADLSPERMALELSHVTPLATDPSEELAALITSHIPRLFNDR